MKRFMELWQLVKSVKLLCRYLFNLCYPLNFLGTARSFTWFSCSRPQNWCFFRPRTLSTYYKSMFTQRKRNWLLMLLTFVPDFQLRTLKSYDPHTSAKGRQSQNLLKKPTSGRSAIFATENSTIVAQVGGTAKLPCAVRKFANAVVSFSNSFAWLGVFIGAVVRGKGQISQISAAELNTVRRQTAYRIASLICIWFRALKPGYLSPLELLKCALDNIKTSKFFGGSLLFIVMLILPVFHLEWKYFAAEWIRKSEWNPQQIGDSISTKLFTDNVQQCFNLIGASYNFNLQGRFDCR